VEDSHRRRSTSDIILSRSPAGVNYKLGHGNLQARGCGAPVDGVLPSDGIAR